MGGPFESFEPFAGRGSEAVIGEGDGLTFMDQDEESLAIFGETTLRKGDPKALRRVEALIAVLEKARAVLAQGLEGAPPR